MKKRTGFVSNSSSSSFILIGNEIYLDAAKKLLREGSPVWFKSPKELSEGSNFVELRTPALADYIDSIENSIEALPEYLRDTETFKEIKFSSWYVGGLINAYEILSESDKTRILSLIEKNTEVKIYQFNRDYRAESEEELLFRVKGKINDELISNQEYQEYLRLKEKFGKIDPTGEES